MFMDSLALKGLIKKTQEGFLIIPATKADGTNLDLYSNTADGKYLNISEIYGHTAYYSVNGEFACDDHMISNYYCFKEGSDEALLISDIFKASVDYKQILMDAMKKELKLAEKQHGIDPDMPGMEALLDYCATSMKGFSIEHDYIQLFYDDMDEAVKTYLGLGEDENAYIYSSPITTLSFTNIGCQNLNIFD